MNELTVIQSVRGYMKNDTAYLNLEDVARGLGFTTVATSGNECVRWARVEEYLNSFGYTISEPCQSAYIPENIFYRLAMKAKNETAEKFQALVADEILPSIRKTGSYNKPQCIEDLIIMQATAMKELRGQVSQLTGTIGNIKEAVISEPDNWREDINRKLNKIAKALGCNKFKEIRSESYKLLEQRAGVNLEVRLDNKRLRMLKEGMSRTAINQANKIDIIDSDKKLREIYGKIVSEYLIKYVA